MQFAFKSDEESVCSASMELVAEKLRAMMLTRLDLDTQAKVAARAQISQASVARILACKQSATLDSLDALARAFGIKTHELLTPAGEHSKIARSLMRLPEQEQTRILSYIELAIQMAAQAPVLSYTESRPAPAHLVAASQRAASKPPSDSGTLIKSTRSRGDEKLQGKTQPPGGQRFN